MATTDFLEYFLVKERLVDLSHRDNLSMAKNGDKEEQLISDIYLARKMIYQQCKSANDLNDLLEILTSLEDNIPEIESSFNPREFKNAWIMTVRELRNKFKKK